MPVSTPTFLAIDPGYDRCGWAVLNTKNKSTAVAYGCIQTEIKTTFFERMKKIEVLLQHIIEQYQPTELAIETLFFAKNQKTALRVAELRGAITLVCLQHAMTIFEYRPIDVKLGATGNGRADKKAVEKMIRLQLQIPASEKLIDDTLDALAVGVTHQTSRKLHLMKHQE